MDRIVVGGTVGLGAADDPDIRRRRGKAGEQSEQQQQAAKNLARWLAEQEFVGYKPQTLVTIEYIESMGDWKTAWDHIHFEGFLGTKMTLQFTWQGCDSLLAAPLVIDLARPEGHEDRLVAFERVELAAGATRSRQGLQAMIATADKALAKRRRGAKQVEQ